MTNENFRKAWANFFNTEARPLERNEYGNKIRVLEPEHFFIYAILRGKNPEKCFDPNSEAYTCAKAEIGNWLRHESRWSNAWDDRYLKPFGDTISKDDIKSAWKEYYEKEAA